MFISMGMQLLIKAPIWVITKILNKSWQWSVLTALAIVVLIAVILVILFMVLPRFKLVQKLIDKLNNNVRDNIWRLYKKHLWWFWSYK